MTIHFIEVIESRYSRDLSISYIKRILLLHWQFLKAIGSSIQLDQLKLPTTNMNRKGRFSKRGVTSVIKCFQIVKKKGGEDMKRNKEKEENLL